MTISEFAVVILSIICLRAIDREEMTEAEK